MTDWSFFVGACFALVNLPYTLLLLAVFLYWGLVILGALDHDSVHVDLHPGGGLDLHADAHVEVHSDLHAGGDAGGAGHVGGAHGALFGALKFLNVGEIPLMLVVSVLAVLLWTGSMLGNWWLANLGAGIGLGLSLLLAIPNLLVGAVLTKVITLPFRRLFRELARETKPYEEICGSVGVVVSEKVDGHSGQVELARKGAPLLLNAVTRRGETLRRGEHALLLAHDQEKGIYIVERSTTAV